MPRLPKLLTATAVALVLMLAAQLYAQDIPDRWMPVRWIPVPSIWPPVYVFELKGYITALVVDPVDPWRFPGLTEHYFHTVDGRTYRLDLSRARFYLCESPVVYVGTEKLVVVNGYLAYDAVYGYPLLIATEVRDPAYPHCG